jgi:hypothetical protein
MPSLLTDVTRLLRVKPFVVSLSNHEPKKSSWNAGKPFVLSFVEA